MAGLVIGSGVATLRGLEATYGCSEIKVLDASGGEVRQEVSVTGPTAGAVDAAIAAIQAMVAPRPAPLPFSTTLTMSSKEAVKLKHSQDAIQARTGCQVDIRFIRNGTAEVVVGGRSEAVRKACVAEVKQALGWRICFPIPADRAGLVIGGGGSVLRRIERTLNVGIVVAPVVAGVREVVITADSQRAAREALADVLRKAGLLEALSPWSGCALCVYNAPDKPDPCRHSGKSPKSFAIR
jgi:hypothetical protein